MVLQEQTDTHPVEQRSRVEDEGDHKGSCPQNFAPLWELQLQEPVERNKVWPSVTLHHFWTRNIWVYVYMKKGNKM